MNKKMFESTAQADGIVRGEHGPSRGFHFDAAKVRKIRAPTGLSQPAQALLQAIKNDPKVVLKALTS